MLENRRVIVGVSASIAIYKSLELIRLLIKAGCLVRVVMSEEAKKFITPLSFEAISQNRVLHSETEDWSSDLNHIGLAKWGEVLVIAPSTANTINKIANGIADNLLLQTILAFDKKILIATSMNSNMLKNPLTQSSLKLLNLNDIKIIESEVKQLACGDIGNGAMADVLEIFYQVARELKKCNFWEERRVVVSGGGSIERIDDVRFISNFSSGKMANAIAKALYLSGADVCFISSKFEDLPKEIHKIEVESAKEFKNYIEDSLRVAKKGVLKKANLKNSLNSAELIQKEPYLFMVSAIADYTPKYPQNGKLKKEFLGESFSLELIQSEDILKSIDKNGVKTVGFKAEFDSDVAFSNSLKALNSKNLDAICLNILESENGFGSDKNRITLITKDKTIDLELDSKLNIAFKLVDLLKDL